MPIPVVYGRFMTSLAQGLIDFESDVIKAMLVGPGYTPNQNTHQYKTSVNSEIVGSGYASGGKQVSGITLNYSSKVLTISASNLSWPVISASNIRYMVLYDDSWPSDAQKPLLLYVDFETNRSPNNQAFYYNWPSGRLLRWSVP
jgi:hypothetical protein